MTVPANIRFNLNAPFPALVTGSGPITIGKQNGIWQIGYTITNLAPIAPSQANLATDVVVVYDTISQTFAQLPLVSLFRFTRFMAGSAVVNFNAGNTDTVITITKPTANYRLNSLVIANATASISTATWGLFSAAGGAGAAIFAAGQATTVTTGTPNASNSLQVRQPATVDTQKWNFLQLFFRVGTPQGAPASATVSIWIDALP